MIIKTEDPTNPSTPDPAVEAKVVVRVDIEPCPNYSEASVQLEITAENLTDAEIPLLNPYTLPSSYTNDVQASDRSGKLTVAYYHGKSVVTFRNGSAILPHGEYTWNVSFTRRLTRHLEGDVLLIHYRIPPQHTFQGYTVRSHTFDVTFRIKKPSNDRWRHFKEYRILVRDNRRLISRVIHEKDATVCRLLSFAVGVSDRDKEVVLNMVCIYGFSSRLLHTLTATITLIATVVAQWLLGRMLP